MSPACWRLRALSETVARRTPSIWARKSWVIWKLSEPTRSMGLRQPSRRALLGGVQPVTGDVLCEESQHGLGVAMQQVVQGAVPGQEPAQSDSVEPKSLSRDLAEAPMRAGRGAEERRQARHTFKADHGDLDRHIVFDRSNHRNDTVHGKVDLGDRVIGVVNL